MVDDRNNDGQRIITPTRKTLRDYVVQQGPIYFSSIVMFAKT